MSQQQQQPLRHSQRKHVLLKNQPEWLLKLHRKLVRNRPSFNEFHIFHEHIDQRGALLLAKGLERNTCIESVLLYNNGEYNVREADYQDMMEGNLPSFFFEIDALIGAIKNAHVKKFMIFHNNLGYDGAVAVARLLQNSPSIHLIDFTNTSLDGRATTVLCNAMERNPFQKLRAIKIDLNEVGIEGVEALTEFFKKNKSIQTFMLSRARVDDFQAAILFLGLEENFTLKRLLLHYNIFGAPCMTQFTSLLKVNTKLRDIRLVRSSLGDEGAKAIAEGLEHNTSVHIMHLQECNIEKEGAMALAKSLAVNSTLLELHLEDNIIEHEGAISFLPVLKEKNMTLTLLSLDEEYKREAYQNRYYCQLNLFGRKYTRNVNLPWGLWPYILARVCNDPIPNVRYGMLLSKPELFRRDQSVLSSANDSPLRRHSERKRKRRKFDGFVMN